MSYGTLESERVKLKSGVRGMKSGGTSPEAEM